MSVGAFRDRVAIAGIGYSRTEMFPGGFSKASGVSVMSLAINAARQACEDAGIAPTELDGVASYAINDSAAPEMVIYHLGGDELNFQLNLLGGGRFSVTSVVAAAQAIHHGICKHVLVFRAMNGRSGVRMGGQGRPALPSQFVGGPQQFTFPYGFSGAPIQYGMEARRWMDLYGVQSEDLAHWAVNSRANATRNPRAMMQTPITVEDHQNSRWVSDPYHLLDCCLETDVGVALVLTSTERARELRRTPVLISAGIGGQWRRDDLHQTGFAQVGRPLLEAADIGLGDLSLAQFYDNFTDAPMRMVEDLGFCDPGEAKDWIKDGRIAIDGELPVQTQGGLHSEGYAHGLNNLAAAVEQLRGQAEDLCPGWAEGAHTYDRAICRQVRDPELALFTSVTGSGGMILRKG